MVTTYTYNNRDQLETESNVDGTITTTYDNDGRMVTKTDAAGITTYTWQDEDRMASITTATGTINYIYDADNARVAVDDGATIKNYLIDTRQQYAQVVAEYDNTLNPTVEYVFGLERITQDRNGVLATYISDGQGSIRQLTNSAGNVTDNYSYYAFGEELSISGSTENEFRYVGEQFDPNSGFYYNRARWYSPTIGRFASVDSWNGDPNTPVSLHRYLYANNNPVLLIDPSGKFSVHWALAPAIMMNILSANAVPTIGTKNTYSLIIYMTDYYSTGPDGVKDTPDDDGIIGFPGNTYSSLISTIEKSFENYNQKSNRDKFKLVWSAGMKSEVFRNIMMSKYSAILSHSSRSFEGLFPSLYELATYRGKTEHINETELQGYAKRGRSTGIFISACNAGWWANGALSAVSKSSTEISELAITAIAELKKASNSK